MSLLGQTYMDIHQSINLSSFEHFARESIEFAHPTRTLTLHRETGGTHG